MANVRPGRGDSLGVFSDAILDVGGEVLWVRLLDGVLRSWFQWVGGKLAVARCAGGNSELILW